MSNITSYNVLKSSGLLKCQLDHVKDLVKTCMEYEIYGIKINYDLLERNTGNINNILIYQDENLVGHLGIYYFNSEEIEVSGVVHPSYRRKNIFTSLVKKMMEELQENRKINKIIFICNKKSISGIKFLSTLRTKYVYSESLMTLASPSNLSIQKPRIHLELATSSDASIIAKITSLAFELPEDEMINMVLEYIDDSNCQTYLIKLGEEVIGRNSIFFNSTNSAFLFGSCILPNFQKKGYGTEAFKLRLKRLLDAGFTNIDLEVNRNKEYLVKYYESFGFIEKEVYQFFEMEVKHRIFN
jgi:RimJ/RimL family protein N-acetyltransferase